MKAMDSAEQREPAKQGKRRNRGNTGAGTEEGGGVEAGREETQRDQPEETRDHPICSRGQDQEKNQEEKNQVEKAQGKTDSGGRKKRLLLVMPKFHDYPEAIMEAAEDLGYETDFVDDRPSERTLVKAVLRLNPELLRIKRARYCEKVIRRTDTVPYTCVLVISGQSLCFDEEMMQRLRFCHPEADFVLYQWDSLANYPRIQRLYPWFDRIYTFDPEDARTHSGVTFLPLFCIPEMQRLRKQKQRQEQGQRREQEQGQEQEQSKSSAGKDGMWREMRTGKETGKDSREQEERTGAEQSGQETALELEGKHWDLVYLGTAHPGRYKRVCEIAAALKVVLPRQLLYHYLPSRLLYWYRRMTGTCFAHTKPWSFHYRKLREAERLTLFQQADIILDSPQDEQTGLTMRCIEAVCAGKKLITTNLGIRDYDFYRPENILVWEETEEAAMAERARIFARTPMVPLPEEIYEKYTLSHWLETLLQQPGADEGGIEGS